MHPLFVYGSLKEGFPNFHVNRGRRLAGQVRTLLPHPLHLVNGRLPCLLPLPGQGLQVAGQLFAVDDAALADMDALERVGRPGGYQRIVIAVQRCDGDGTHAAQDAWVYVQDPALLDAAGSHEGPLAEYTTEHARKLRW
jgi:gamma-glutamylaminecyclotransferase